MRILFVTPYVPSRIRVRPFNFIKLLAQQHEISLVTLLVDKYEATLVQDVEPYCTSIDLVSLPKKLALRNCLLALPTSMPLRVAYYRSPAFIQCIREVIHRQKIDVIHGELIKVVPALQAIQAEEQIPILYDAVDCISWFLQQKLATTHNLLQRLFVTSELNKMRRYEQETLRSFEQITITTTGERERLGQITAQPEKISVVSSCVDTNYFHFSAGPRQNLTLVFCAKLDYFPNAQAILHFCTHVLPLVWQQQPDVRLLVVGNNPPPAVQLLGKNPRITVTGYVPDIRPYLGTAHVALAPLLVAAGIQCKLMEALAMGTPLVTTSLCNTALGTQDNVHLLVADEPSMFAQAILRLLTDVQLAQRLGHAGRRFVLNNYSWQQAASTLNALYRQLAPGTLPDQELISVQLDKPKHASKISRVTS